MGYSDKVCCCIPSRLGVLLMSSIIFCVYFVGTVLLFVYKGDLQAWSTLEQKVDTPLTIEAFNGVFYAFAVVFILYTIVSLMGIIAISIRHRKLVRIYHVVNWFFVLLLLTVTIAYWIYFKVKQDVFINDCQDMRNVKNNVTADPMYTPIQIPGKPLVASGSDKSECINLIKKLVAGSGVCVFLCNFIQLYWARSIGVYATALKKNYQHKKLEIRDDDDMLFLSRNE